MAETAKHGTDSRTFWKFWTASAISTTGTGISTVALPLVALSTLNPSNFEMGLLTAAGYAAIVVIGLPAGVIVQRYPLRGLQVVTNLVQAAAMLTIPVAVWLDLLSLAQLLVVALVVGLAGSLFDVANSTAMPRIVPREQLVARNGLISGTFATTQTVGPALGGLLVQTAGAAAGILTDAVSYLVSAVILGRTDALPSTPPPAERVSLSRQIGEGLRFVFGHPVIRPSVIAATAVNFAAGAVFAVMSPFLVRSLGLGPGQVGLMFALDGVGTVVGAAAVAPLSRRFGSGRMVLVAVLGGALLSLFMPLASGRFALISFGIGVTGFAAGVVMLSVLTRTHRQTVSPPEILPRVMASVRFVSWSAIPIGSLVAGTLAQLWEPRAGLAAAAVAAAAAPLALGSSRVRRLHHLEDAA
ncbi:MFS transporter [Paractinoplanes ferrugineus]|uniref:MFS transporter n=1 Tax=Paractinoplanes ferrugineus TaxID=113564 RepID=A0A919MI00_9ACTN|nr:MFS transporter [Actinoplanes ferrugineus]GIE15484.1 MFS transporter [Actinoplanes ferrugineus]